MAKYRVWLTVQDSYGNAKEIDGGIIDVDLGLTNLSQTEVDQLAEALPLEDYIKRDNLDTELTDWATDQEVDQAVANTVKYGGFKFRNSTTGEAGDK